MSVNNLSHSDAPQLPRRIRTAMLQTLLPILVLYPLLPLAKFCPILDPTRSPFFDLASPFATLALFVSMFGGRIGAPILGTLLLLLIVTRPGLKVRRRWLEFLVIGCLYVSFAGGFALLNEHVIKPAFAVPRPNIAWLAGPQGNGPLKMTAAAFYELGDKSARRVPLRSVLRTESHRIPLTPEVREHWIYEVGFSFPSGHAFASLFCATFFPALAASWVSGRRRWIFYLMPLFAVAVCWSRLALRVHTPWDVTVGGVQGVMIALTAFLIARVCLPRSTDLLEAEKTPLA